MKKSLKEGFGKGKPRLLLDKQLEASKWKRRELSQRNIKKEMSRSSSALLGWLKGRLHNGDQKVGSLQKRKRR